MIVPADEEHAVCAVRACKRLVNEGLPDHEEMGDVEELVGVVAYRPDGQKTQYSEGYHTCEPGRKEPRRRPIPVNTTRSVMLLS